jgi:parallel beta-helix repeat protein
LVTAATGGLLLIFAACSPLGQTRAGSPSTSQPRASVPSSTISKSPATGTEPTSSVPSPPSGAEATPVAAPTAPVFVCTVNLDPASDLVSSVQAAPPGSHFCLASGTYRISAPVEVKTDDTFSGSASHRPVIDASATEDGFDTHDAANVVYENLVVEGAQSPGKSCGVCGRGIWGGDNMKVFNVEAADNAVNGIAGGLNTYEPWTIVGSQLVDNGSLWAVGFSSGGVKASNSYTILNSYVVNNIGQGIWCDVGCLGGTWTVEGNTVTGNSDGGIRYEISDVGAIISGNLVQSNNTSDQTGLGGITVASSGNATVANNTVTDNGWGQIVFGGNGRNGAVRVNDIAQNNTVSGLGQIRGCQFPGVTCRET